MSADQKKRGRPRKTARDRACDRASIVSAASSIIVESGWQALSSRGVADRAGIAVGSVFNEFPTMEALRLEANVATMKELRVELSQAVDRSPGADVEDVLMSLANAYAGFARNNRNAWVAMLAPRTGPPPPAIAAEIAALFGILGRVLRDAGMPEDVVPVAVKALWSSVHGMVQLGEAGGLGPISSADVGPMMDLLVRSAVRGFGSPKRSERE